MDKEIRFKRPTFDNAITAWKAELEQREFPTDCTWIFDENLCFEKDPSRPSGFRLGFQTRFTPPPPDAERIAYEYFTDFDMPLILYRLGSCGGKSICLFLCDRWFASKGEADGFLRRDQWRMMLRPGANVDVEEITDEARWRTRQLRDRALHDLDFCMTLRGVHEILAHGRVLSAYEHYALRFLGAWRRMLE